MTPFLRNLDCARQRARERATRAQSELDRFDFDAANPRHHRLLSKLQDDLASAERDAAWAEQNYQKAASVDEANIAFKWLREPEMAG